MCSLSREQSILSRETIQNTFFHVRIMPIFRLRLCFPYQAPHSRALAPACCALVFFFYYIKCVLNGSDPFTHFHTTPHFDALKTYGCGKHWEKRRICVLQAIYPFFTMFSTLYGTYFSF